MWELIWQQCVINIVVLFILCTAYVDLVYNSVQSVQPLTLHERALESENNEIGIRINHRWCTVNKLRFSFISAHICQLQSRLVLARFHWHLTKVHGSYQQPLVNYDHWFFIGYECDKIPTSGINAGDRLTIKYSKLSSSNKGLQK